MNMTPILFATGNTTCELERARIGNHTLMSSMTLRSDHLASPSRSVSLELDHIEFGLHDGGEL